MKYTSLLIDIDDTLLDFSAAEKSAVSGVLKNNDLPFDDDTVTLYSRINLEFWKSFERGDILREEIFEGRFKKLLSIIGKTGDTKKIADEYFFALANEHQLMQGATDILDYLSKKGYEVIDKRAKGGALWIVGGKELDSVLKETKKSYGALWTFCKNGGGSTSHRPSWFTQCKK